MIWQQPTPSKISIPGARRTPQADGWVTCAQHAHTWKIPGSNTCRPTSWLVQWHSTESSPHWGHTSWSNTEFLPSWNHCIYHRRHTTYLSESLFKGNSPFPALGRYHLTLGLLPISSTDLGLMERGGDENKVLQKKNIPMTTLLHSETQI